jgi:CheY-like chemotaxis protein
MLGHELRNPLSPIVMALQLMRLRGDKKSVKEQEIIDRQVKHLTRLVDDLLDVSRVARGKIELARKPLQLADVIIRAVEMASPLLEVRRHQLTVSVPHRGLMVLADETRLGQVFANLLTNAAKYTDPGGAITIAAERVENELVVRVRDNGIGIAPDLLPRVFDLFVQGEQTSERSRGGLGLGLTLVRRLIELQGGSVRAHSDGLGEGSEFTVRLPALTMELVADADEEEAPDARVAPGGGRRVLVVDDNVDAAELLCELLRTVGHDVAVAHDGPQGVERALQLRPEVAIVDIGLPVMDGYEVAERIRSGLGAGTPYLIALTGYGQEHDKRRAEQAGFDRHMTKPLDPEALLQALRLPSSTATSS